MSQRELARAVGISTGGVHYVISALVDKGFIKLAQFTAADQRRYAYLLTPQGIDEKIRLTIRFVRIKMAEYAALNAELEALYSELPPRNWMPSGRACAPEKTLESFCRFLPLGCADYPVVLNRM